MKYCKSILSLFLSFSMMFSSAVFAYATDISSEVSATLWDRYWHMAATTSTWIDIPWIGSFLTEYYSWMSSGTCPASSDNWHHSLGYESKGTDSKGNYFDCLCLDCHDSFKVYAEDLSDAYNQYVTDLQTDLGTTTLIDGGVRIYSRFNETFISSSNYLTLNNSVVEGSIFSCNGIWKSTTVPLQVKWYAISVPFAGHAIGHIAFVHDEGLYYSNTQTLLDADVTKGEQIYPFVANVRVLCDESFLNVNRSFAMCQYIDLYPVSGDLPTVQDITINSRPTSITGDYGIIGDDGTIIKVDKTIVDEGNSIVYNPVTNTTHNYTDYAYDYSDRSYNLTLEDGSTMKVVYGDENVTIEEGDTVYNVYYLTSGSDDGSGGSGSAGDDGSGGIGGAIGGLFDVLGEIIYGLIEGTINLATKALSALTGLLDLLKQFGESIVGFFGGYLDFLGAVFPFLPEETFTILNLGLILMIAAAVFKKFL